jgi:hypothetical protein
MAQHDYIISNATFPATRTDINNALSAIQTTNSGTSRPTGAVAGQLWLDTTSATTPTLKYYDGADDISLATIDHTANTVNWLDSTVSITGLSTTATGTVLTLSDSATTSTVNLIIDNDKEIRFREATANGTNYISLSAPASVTADVTYTLPVAPTANNQALISSTAGVMSFTPYTFPSSDGTNGQALVTNGSAVLSFASAGTSWQSVQTSGFTAVAGRGYPCNTTSSAFTVTLPASASTGDTIQLVDYAGTFATNNLTINPNSLKIQTQTSNVIVKQNNEALTLTYINSTSGWLITSSANEGTSAITIPYSIDFLVLAGGAGAGGKINASNGSGGGGAGGYRSSNATYGSSGGGGSAESGLLFTAGVSYTITVGGGGAGSSGQNNNGTNGSNSSISGSGITTITSSGGGGGGATYDNNGSNGGSGGGGVGNNAGGTGTANQGYAGGNASAWAGAGGGGAGAIGGNTGSGGPTSIGGNGGNGVASTITASSVTRGGGGGGGSYGTTQGTGGTGGGANGVNGNGASASSNTGGGGGGAGGTGGSTTGGNGGSGVVIIRVPTAKYSGTTTGSPTVTTSGSDTILVFNSSGTITG